jgi:hypothetical protein
MTVAIPVSSTVALATYADLLTEVPLYLNRTDLAARIPTFIRLAEAEINRRLALKPVRPMLTRDTLTIDNEYVAAPTDLLKPASLQLSDGTEMKYVDPTNISRLKSDAVEALEDWLLGMTSESPTAMRWYTLVEGEFRFYPVPTEDDDATLTYWARLSPLTETSDSNWMLDDHPDVYWYGVLAHASRHIRDDQDAASNATLFDDALQKVLDAYPARSNMTPLRSDVPPANRSCFT